MDTNSQALRDTFARFGEVEDVELGGVVKGGAKHVAHVVFQDPRWTLPNTTLEAVTLTFYRPSLVTS